MKYAIPACLLCAGAAAAHPGHDAALVQGGGHWLTAGDHLIVVALAALGLGFGGRIVLRRLRARRARRARA